MSEPTGARRYGVGGGDAYYDAVRYGGYEGTREQFGRDQAEFAQNAAAVAEAKEAVERDAEEVRNTKNTFENTTVPEAIRALEQESEDQILAITQKGEEVSQQVETVGTEQKDAVANEGRARVEAIQQAGTTQVQNVNDAGTTQVGNVNQAGEDQVDAVEQAGADQVQAVTDEGTTQIRAVTDEGNIQVQRVQDKGDEVLDSIPADYTALDQKVDNLKSAITQIISDYDNLTPYFYKSNIYINNSGVETALQGYDTYKIPVNVGDIIRFSWESLSTLPWGTSLSNSYAIHVHKSDDTYLNMSTTIGNVGRIWVANKEAFIIAPTDADFVTITILPDNIEGVKIEKNHPTPNLIDDEKVSIYDTVFIVNEQNAIKTQFYVDRNGNYQVMGNTVSVFSIKIKNGDEAIFQSIPTGTSFRGTFRANDGASQEIGTIISSPFKFKATTDGVLFVFAVANGNKETIISPKSQIMISNKNVYGLADGVQYSGLYGVAFGTSLTYYASLPSSTGYLRFLEQYSEIIFDNQGVGSATILGDGGAMDMLAKIKSYTSYSEKNVCILEGFINDWYEGNTLGTWTDSGETTVCGCIRSALNYMLSQNANMTIFLILDHYGRNYNSLDCSTTSTNANGLTQYEFYSEIAKVAESLGIPVIAEFILSQISENTPQFLADNIHVNTLGAKQSASVIWSKMKQFPVNAVS